MGDDMLTRRYPVTTSLKIGRRGESVLGIVRKTLRYGLVDRSGRFHPRITSFSDVARRQGSTSGDDTGGFVYRPKLGERETTPYIYQITIALFHNDKDTVQLGSNWTNHR
jgi:hypothetical protein